MWNGAFLHDMLVKSPFSIECSVGKAKNVQKITVSRKEFNDRKPMFMFDM